MITGIPKEIKNREYRVGMTPDGIRELTESGYMVLVESGAGEGSGFTDEEYRNSGAEITDKEKVFSKSDLIVKIKEPLPEEFPYFRTGQMLFTYLHLASNPALVQFLLKSGVTALGYETLQSNGEHPLLSPMSEVAGRMAPLIGSYYLQKSHGGTGILPPGVPGTDSAAAVIIGAGRVGSNAARVSHGIGMNTTVLNRSEAGLHRIDDLFLGDVNALVLNRANLERSLGEADIVVGALYSHGARTPVVVSEEMVKGCMKKGAVIIDVSVDQGGCVENIRPTSHDAPIYEKYGVIHYAVTNMPGAYPRTSTQALTNATLKYIKKILASSDDLEREPLNSAINIRDGKILLDELK